MISNIQKILYISKQECTIAINRHLMPISVHFFHLTVYYRDHEDLPGCLTEQLRLYKEKMFSDEEQMAMPGGVDINSHEDLFRALLEKVNLVHSTCT